MHHGRLAQLGERLVYTQEVGGSIPSPPISSYSRLARFLGGSAGSRSRPAPILFVQAFGLGGVVSSFGLALDLIGFLLLVIFIAASSVIGLIRSAKPVAASRLATA
jgi:hypothetical protein